jgi:type IV pilus assembly protein PilC
VAVLGPKTPQLLIFTKQVEVALQSGLPVHIALDVCAGTAGPLQQAVQQVLKLIFRGETLSRALEDHPQIFGDLYRSLIQMGEKTGTLTEAFGLLAVWLEEENHRRAKVRTVLIYPALVLLVAAVMGGFTALFVLPPFLEVLTEIGAPLPLPTRLLMTMTGLITKPAAWVTLLLLIGAWVAFLKQWLATPEGRLSLDRVLLSVPILGHVLRDLSLMRMCAALSAVLQAGTDIVQGLQQASATAQSAVLEEDVQLMISKVQLGETISSHMESQAEIYPKTMSSLIHVGEEIGRLPRMFGLLKVYFEDEVEYQLATITALLEPVLIGGLALLVGGILLALLLPLYSFLTTIG